MQRKDDRLELGSEIFYAWRVRERWVQASVARSVLCVCTLLVWRSVASAQPVQLAVEVAADSCPDAAAVERALRPVLERGASLWVAADVASVTAARRARVRDLGERYVVEIDGDRREIDDAARDCVERARVASVFIALNVKKPPQVTGATASAGAEGSGAAPRGTGAQAQQGDGAQASTDGARERPRGNGERGAADRAGDTASDADVDLGEDADEDVDEAADERAPELPPPPPGFGLRVFGAGERAIEHGEMAFGAGAGAFYGVAPFRFELAASALAPFELELAENEEAAGNVRLLRLPMSLTASYLLRAGGFELGPAAGLALELLRAQGEGLPRTNAGMRANAGLLLALEAHLWTRPRFGSSSALGLGLSLQMRAFPASYNMVVEPVGALASTPTLWLGAQLGLQWRF